MKSSNILYYLCKMQQVGLMVNRQRCALNERPHCRVRDTDDRFTAPDVPDFSRQYSESRKDRTEYPEL